MKGSEVPKTCDSQLLLLPRAPGGHPGQAPLGKPPVSCPSAHTTGLTLGAAHVTASWNGHCHCQKVDLRQGRDWFDKIWDNLPAQFLEWAASEGVSEEGLGGRGSERVTLKCAPVVHGLFC